MTKPYARPVIIAGTGHSAEVLAAFIGDSGLGEIAAFTVEGAHVDRNELRARPVVAMEVLSDRYPPSEFCVVNAIGYNSMNDTRRRISDHLREQGYELPGFIHPDALLDPNVSFESNLIAVQGVIVEPFATLGRDVTLWTGCYVGHHTTLADGVYVGPRAAIPGTVMIGENCFIGANATVRSKIKIGARCLVGAGCYVHKDVPDKSILRATPATASSRSSDNITYFN